MWTRVTDAMSRENFTIASSRGDEELNCYRWMPEGEPVAALQIVHGMTEHILRYSDFAEFLNGRGFAVYGHDHLGHGGTSEEKGFIAEEHGDDMLVADMARVNVRMTEDLPGIPHFVMGHSMGSFVTRRFLTLHGKDVDGAVIMGTGQQAGYQVSLALAIAKLLHMLTPQLTAGVREFLLRWGLFFGVEKMPDVRRRVRKRAWNGGARRLHVLQRGGAVDPGESARCGFGCVGSGLGEGLRA